jgi:hypothetical protein
MLPALELHLVEQLVAGYVLFKFYGTNLEPCRS